MPREDENVPRGILGRADWPRVAARAIYSTEVGKIFFFCSLWKRAVREEQKPSLVPAESMLEVTPLVCV